MIQFFQALMARRREDGASAVEYGLMVAAIAAIIVGLVFAIGKFVQGGFDTTCEGIANGDSSTATSAADCV